MVDKSFVDIFLFLKVATCVDLDCAEVFGFSSCTLDLKVQPSLASASQTSYCKYRSLIPCTRGRHLPKRIKEPTLAIPYIETARGINLRSQDINQSCNKLVLGLYLLLPATANFADITLNEIH